MISIHDFIHVTISFHINWRQEGSTLNTGHSFVFIRTHVVGIFAEDRINWNNHGVWVGKTVVEVAVIGDKVFRTDFSSNLGITMQDVLEVSVTECDMFAIWVVLRDKAMFSINNAVVCIVKVVIPVWVEQLHNITNANIEDTLTVIGNLINSFGGEEQKSQSVLFNFDRTFFNIFWLFTVNGYTATFSSTGFG
jgi:hypothetical protein